MNTKPAIDERIAFYENKITEYSKNERLKHRLETTRSLLEFWKAQLRKYNQLNKNK